MNRFGKIAASTLLLGFFFSLLCCKKQQDDDCINSGVIRPNKYLFWVMKDFGGGEIAVEVKDSEGKIVTPYQNKIKYTSSVAPECTNENYSKFATFNLNQGQNYTYKASCAGKNWKGAIHVACEQNQCRDIELQ